MLLLGQQNSISSIAHIFSIADRETLRLENNNLRKVTSGWLDEARGMKVEIADKGVLQDNADLEDLTMAVLMNESSGSNIVVTMSSL